MNAGKLVPDKVLLDIIRDRITQDDCKAGYLLDGFPRTLNQAVGLDEILESINQSLDFAISLTANEQELINRLINRGIELGFDRFVLTSDRRGKVRSNISRLGRFEELTGVKWYTKDERYQTVPGGNTLQYCIWSNEEDCYFDKEIR